MQTLRRGLVAGLLAGLVLAMLDFVMDGTPGRPLPVALHWFGITIADSTISRIAGFFLLLVLGGVFGLIFGALQRERIITISRTLLWWLALGFVWWLVFSLLLANTMSHHAPFSLDFGRFLSTFPIDLLFGVVLGAINFQTRATACGSDMVSAIVREKRTLLGVRSVCRLQKVGYRRTGHETPSV